MPSAGKCSHIRLTGCVNYAAPDQPADAGKHRTQDETRDKPIVCVDTVPNDPIADVGLETTRETQKSRHPGSPTTPARAMCIWSTHITHTATFQIPKQLTTNVHRRRKRFQNKIYICCKQNEPACLEKTLAVLVINQFRAHFLIKTRPKNEPNFWARILRSPIHPQTQNGGAPPRKQPK